MSLHCLSLGYGAALMMTRSGEVLALLRGLTDVFSAPSLMDSATTLCQIGEAPHLPSGDVNALD